MKRNGPGYNLALTLVSIFLTLATPNCAWSTPDSADLTKLEKDKIRIRELVHISEKSIPTLFSQSAVYEFNLLKIMALDEELREQLIKMPRYQELLSEKTSLLTLDILPLKDIQTKTIKVTPQALKNWKDSLAQTASSLVGAGELEQKMRQLLKAQLDVVGLNSSNNLITGLIQLLPPTMKAEAFQAQDLESRFHILEKNLTSDIPATFLSKNQLQLGMNKIEVFEYIKKVAKAEVELINFVELMSLFQDQDGLIQMEPTELVAKIQALTEQHLSLLGDTDFLSPKVRQIQNNFSGEHVVAQFSKIIAAIKNHIRLIRLKTEVISGPLMAPLKLVEVPPRVGILRGCIGGDCSTQMSFPFPNDPHERIFFIYGKKDIAKGYLEATLVDTGARRALYVTCINGARIDSGDVEQVLHGLSSNLKDLGVDEILLPEKTNIESLINYGPIRAVFKKYAKLGQSVPVHFRDPEIRQLIENTKSKYHTSNYDHMKNHKQAIVFVPDRTQSAVSLQVSHQSQKEELPVELTVRQKFRVFVEWSARRTTSTEDLKQRDRLINAMELDQKRFNELLETLKNSKGHELAKFDRKVNEAIQKLFPGLEIETDRNLLILKAMGSLQASDALSEEVWPEVAMRSRLLLAASEFNGEQGSGSSVLQYFRDQVLHHKISMGQFKLLFENNTFMDQDFLKDLLINALFPIANQFPNEPVLQDLLARVARNIENDTAVDTLVEMQRLAWVAGRSMNFAGSEIWVTAILLKADLKLRRKIAGSALAMKTLSPEFQRIAEYEFLRTVEAVEKGHLEEREVLETYIQWVLPNLKIEVGYRQLLRMAQLAHEFDWQYAGHLISFVSKYQYADFASDKSLEKVLQLLNQSAPHLDYVLKSWQKDGLAKGHTAFRCESLI